MLKWLKLRSKGEDEKVVLAEVTDIRETADGFEMDFIEHNRSAVLKPLVDFGDLPWDAFPDVRVKPNLTRILNHKHRMHFMGVEHEEAYFGDPVIADDRFGWICSDYDCAYQIYIMRWKWEQMLRGFW